MVWILDYVPLFPMSPIKLFFGLWILLPAYQGESIVYMCLSDHLLTFEMKIAEIYSKIVSTILLYLISWISNVSAKYKASVNLESLPKLKALTEKIDSGFKLEI